MVFLKLIVCWLYVAYDKTSRVPIVSPIFEAILILGPSAYCDCYIFEVKKVFILV